MKRVGQMGEFRANLHRGGNAERVELTDEERQHGRARGRRRWASTSPASTCCAPTAARS